MLLLAAQHSFLQMHLLSAAAAPVGQGQLLFSCDLELGGYAGRKNVA